MSHTEGRANRGFAASRALLERARRVVPSMSQTFSKGPTQYVQGISPTFLARGKGSHVWDVDGNEFIDYVGSLGPIILGYDHPAVTEAVTKQVRDGAIFSLPHPLEVDVSEKLVELIPCAEMVRFAKNGSDATAGAVRVARAFTGRDVIACCGYHGWQDWFIGTTTRSLGVPKAVRDLTFTFEYNRIESLERLFAEHPGKIAAVVMEPVGVVEPTNGFLEAVRKIATDNGALLIFDEVVTGFRLSLGGAQQHFGVTPDLACFGKAMANGFALSAVVGRADVMRTFDDIFFSFTFGGDAIGLAAAAATIDVMQKDASILAGLWKSGDRIRDGFNAMANELGVASYVKCIGLGPRTVIDFKDAPNCDALIVRSLVQQELIKRGILFLAGHNMCAAHDADDVSRTLEAHRAALDVLSKAITSGEPRRFLEGEPVQAVFRRA